MGSDFAFPDVIGCLSHFNPRSPHGERPAILINPASATRISIHAPRMGSDDQMAKVLKMQFTFQSTLPAWGATVQSKHTAMTA